MASQAPKQRTKHDQPPSASSTTTTTSSSTRKARKMAMARRGARSLALAVLVPLMLTSFSAYLSGCSGGKPRQFWHPPAWAFHLAAAAASGLMGLSAWLVWAEGGFHRDPALAALYSGQLATALLWGPVVLGLGAGRAGLAVCAAMSAATLGCARRFGRVNPVAGDLVKPCLAWVALLAVFTYKLID